MLFETCESLKRDIGVHHSGILTIVKEIIELFFTSFNLENIFYISSRFLNILFFASLVVYIKKIFRASVSKL